MKPCRYECDECPERGLCFAMHVADGAEVLTIECRWVIRTTSSGKQEPSVWYRSECETEAEEAQKYDGESLVREREFSDWKRRKKGI